MEHAPPEPGPSRLGRWAFGFALAPLVADVPYAIAWHLRPTEFLNSTLGYPLAGLSVLSVGVSALLGVALLLTRRARGLARVGAVLAADILLGLWLVVAGPGLFISVSEVVVVNHLQTELRSIRVECPGYRTSIARIPAGARRNVPVMPNNEGRLKVTIRLPGGEIASHDVFILECCPELFVFHVSAEGLRSDPSVDLPK